MNKIVPTIFVLSCLVVLSSIASAQVIVGGKIYNDISSQLPAQGVIVDVTCEGNTVSNVTSFDGSYGVAFDSSQCGQGDVVVVSSSNGGKTVSQNAELNIFINYSNGEFYLVVSNLDYSSVVKPTPTVTTGTSGSGGSGRVLR